MQTLTEFRGINAFISENVFTLSIGDGRSAKELLGAGRYDVVSKEVLQDFKWRRIHTSNKPANVDLVLVTFRYRFWPEEVPSFWSGRIGGTFSELGLEYPTKEDALRFGIQFRNEDKDPFVFIHEPKGKGYQHDILGLCWDTEGRRVLEGVNCDFLTFKPNCRFVARRPRKV